MWGTLDENGIWWLGGSGTGKTQTATTVAMARSRQLTGQSSCVVVLGVEFVPQVRSLTPLILNDFETDRLSTGAIKVFPGVGADRVALGRCGSFRIATGCCSQAVSNASNVDVAPNAAASGWTQHRDFLEVMGPALHAGAAPADAMRIFKCANVVISTKSSLCYRLADGSHVDAPLISMGGERPWIKTSWGRIDENFLRERRRGSA